MPRVHRREFVQALAATVAAPALLRAAHRGPRYPIGFSTLGCPGWDWKTILRHADEWGYRAIEIRGIQGEMDLLKRPELQGSRLADTLKSLAALDLVVSDLGSSAHLHDRDEAKRKQNLDEARRFIDLAHTMGAAYVRVFGNEVPKGEPAPEALKRIGEGLHALGDHAQGSGVTVLLETHGDLVKSQMIEAALAGAGPNVAVLWDARHTFVMGHEAPQVTFDAIGKLVRHVHLKDSRVGAEGPDLSPLIGEGEVPVRGIVSVLAKGGYEGFYSFEWEKVWHPEIPEPEVAFPQYARTVGRYLEEAGVKAA
jgi:sugar phosphate isomerase/epimerase